MYADARDPRQKLGNVQKNIRLATGQSQKRGERRAKFKFAIRRVYYFTLVGINFVTDLLYSLVNAEWIYIYSKLQFIHEKTLHAKLPFSYS